MAACKQRLTTPSYFETLNSSAKARYTEKVAIIDKLDPYAISRSEFSADPSILPSITYPDIVNYLVYSPSPYSLDDLRCYKGLDAYNQFVNGWVRDVTTKIINGFHLVIGRVMHSQRLRETPLKPWLIADKSGKIICGHCNCMAGLGETCTHVSALLFYIDTKVRVRDSRTVTQEAAYWKLPTSMREVTYLPVSQMDFTSAKSKKKQLDSFVCNSVVLTPGKRQVKDVPTPTNEDLKAFFQNLSQAGSKAAVLTVVPEHCKAFKPTPLADKFPLILTNLYKHDYAKLPFNELMSKCEDIVLTVTEEQAKCVEQSTRTQAANKMWFRFRAGRVTASRMKQICKSNPDQPSQSLVKSVCYPQNGTFTADATNWGCSHEKSALTMYKEKMEVSHDNFDISVSGFNINPDFPHIGATPDALVRCDCCGNGAVEVKCPYCARDSTVEEYATSTERSRTCLSKDGDSLTLKKDHGYMYQIQTQIHVCNVEFADFVLWTKKDIHIERIERDSTLWIDMYNNSLSFFRKAILPELIGKFYSRPVTSSALQEVCMLQTTSIENSSSSSKDLGFCYCGGPEDIDDMIGCDNENCKLQWYHLGCLKIKCVPKGKWFCPECRKLSKNKLTKSKR